MSTQWVKRRLRAHGFWPQPFPINSGRGPVTRRQIRRFQASVGLAADAVVGPLTTAALKAQPVNKRGERARAVGWANDAVGVVEHPAGSNDGPRIRKWWQSAGYTSPVPYCACFVACAVQHATRKRVKASQLGGYCPAIVSMARSNRYGLRIVQLKDARPGDIVMFDFGHETYDHTGLFLSHDGDSIRTIEANTSPDTSLDQSIQAQANGGGVFRRRRSRSLVSAVVRPPYRN